MSTESLFVDFKLLAKGASHLEGTLPEPEIADHWLVKFPRGQMTLENQDVLRAKGVFYRALDQLGQNTIRGAHVVEGKVPALWLPRFDREVTPDGVLRYGVESIYSLNQMIGDGAKMKHPDVLARLRKAVAHPPEFDETLCEYLVRDVINYTIGNSDNHGRNTALIKRDGRISLSPAYDHGAHGARPGGDGPDDSMAARVWKKRQKPIEYFEIAPTAVPRW